METREAVGTGQFTPFGDQVVLRAERETRKNKLILPDSVKQENVEIYTSVTVVGYGPKTSYTKIGDRVKLSEFGMNVAPELLYSETDDEGDEVTSDFLLISEAFIKGRWDKVEPEIEDE